MKDAFGKKISVKEIDDIEQPFLKQVTKWGWLCEKVVSLSRNGWPDRFLARKGRIVLCEFKRPGEKPTPQQDKRHRELRAFGIEVVWFDNLAKALDYFRP